MYIEKLEVKGFGKLKNRSIRLRKGINLIYGDNEAGKSTLQWFITGMLYGLKNGKQGRNSLMQPQKRFSPWGGGVFRGAMVYVLNDGSTYRLERDFQNGTVQLYDSNFNNITNSFPVGRDKQPMIAERQFGIDEATFERTALIRQMEVRLDENSAASLASRLANVSSTGFEELSFSRAEKALTQALKNNVGTDRTTTQPLDKLEARLKQLELSRDRLEKQRSQSLLAREELKRVQNQIEQLKKNTRYLEHISTLVGIREALDSNLKKETGLKEILKHLAELDKTPVSPVTDSMHNGPVTNSFHVPAINNSSGKGKGSGAAPVLYLSSAVVFAVLSVYIAITKGWPHAWQLILVLCAGVVCAAAAGVAGLRRNATGYRQRALPDKEKSTTGLLTEDTRDIEAAEAAIRSGEREAERNTAFKSIFGSASLLCGKQIRDIVAVKEELRGTEAELDLLSTELERGIAAAKAIHDAQDSISHYDTQESVFHINELDTRLYDSGIAELKSLLQEESERYKSLSLEAALKEKYYEGLLQDVLLENEELQQVVEEAAAIKENISLLRFKGSALKLAHEVLTEAGLEIKNSFAPDLNNAMSSVINGLTAGKYDDLRGDDKLFLNVAVPESGDVKNALSLSGAATDQMYLALRLAMTGILHTGKEELPLIMDEAFSQFDDKRTELALQYLYHAYESKQALIFTCKQREVELAQKICGSDLNLVLL